VARLSRAFPCYRELSKGLPCYGELSRGLPCYGQQRKLRKEFVPARAPTQRFRERKVRFWALFGGFSEFWKPLDRLQGLAGLYPATASLARVYLATGSRDKACPCYSGFSKAFPCYRELNKGLPCYGHQRKLRKELVPARAPTQRFQERKVRFWAFFGGPSESWKPLDSLQSLAGLYPATASLARVCLATGSRDKACPCYSGFSKAFPCYGLQSKDLPCFGRQRNNRIWSLSKGSLCYV
jgi:hypothetical protein